MTLLLHNFSGNVFANSNQSYLIISASKFHWRQKPTAARRSGKFSEIHGALRTHAHVAQQFLLTKCPQMVKNEQWLISSPDLKPLEISRLKSDAWNFLKALKTLSELNVALQKMPIFHRFNWESHLEFQKQVERVREGWWRTFRAFTITLKCSHLRCLRCIKFRQFMITSKLLGCHDLKPT